jgi:hypothetical protein
LAAASPSGRIGWRPGCGQLVILAAGLLGFGARPRPLPFPDPGDPGARIAAVNGLEFGPELIAPLVD